MSKIPRTIHVETHHTIYVGNTDVTLVTLEENVLSHILISSVNNSNKEKLFIDNIFYIKHIEYNKRDLKQKLTEKGLWEKGVVKAIKLLSKKVI
jgi:hypothetical protein